MKRLLIESARNIGMLIRLANEKGISKKDIVSIEKEGEVFVLIYEGEE